MSKIAEELNIPYELSTIEVNSIEFGERQRTEYEDIDELAQSIKANGLLCPVLVHKTKDGFGLIAGGRRIKAFKQLEEQMIDAKIFERMPDEHVILMMEWEENFQRKDLSWFEQRKARERIHKALVEIKGTHTGNTKGIASGHSKADTARLLSISPAALHGDLKLVEQIENLPESARKAILKTKNKSQAVKLLDTTQKLATSMKRSETIQKKLGNDTDTIMQNIISSYVVKDIRDGLKGLGDSTFDLVELDPPYAIDYTNQLAESRQLTPQDNNYNEIPANEYIQFIEEILKGGLRVLRNSGWLLLWHSATWTRQLIELFDSMNEDRKILNLPRFRHNLLYWTKPSGKTRTPKYVLASAVEPVFYIRKGPAELVKQGRTNVYHYASPSTRNHPTEKPEDLMEDLYGTFVMPGANVLIGFAGSGVGLLTAYEMNMQPIGFDKSDLYKNSYIVRAADKFGTK